MYSKETTIYYEYRDTSHLETQIHGNNQFTNKKAINRGGQTDITWVDAYFDLHS